MGFSLLPTILSEQTCDPVVQREMTTALNSKDVYLWPNPFFDIHSLVIASQFLQMTHTFIWIPQKPLALVDVYDVHVVGNKYRHIRAVQRPCASSPPQQILMSIILTCLQQELAFLCITGLYNDNGIFLTMLIYINIQLTAHRSVISGSRCFHSIHVSVFLKIRHCAWASIWNRITGKWM